MMLLVMVRMLARGAFRLALLAIPVVAAAQLYRHYLDPHPGAPDVLLVNVWVTLVGGVVGALWLVARVADAWPHMATAPDTTHGTARWGSPPRTLVADRRGLIIGRECRVRGSLLRYGGDAHVLTLAPTGAGKGIGCVVPNLLTYPGSVLVTDPKGENYAVTARRRRAHGHCVIALDPFGLVGGTGAFNPLDGIDVTSADAVDNAAALAELLVVREPRESGDTVFWAEEAKALLTGLILHAVSSEPATNRTLSAVWSYLSLPPRELTKLWSAMGSSCAAGGAVARAAARVRQKQDRVRSGILAHAQSQAHFLDSPQLARTMQRSSFSFADLRAQPLTVYLVLPPDRIDSARRWLRLLVGCGINALMRARAPSTGVPHRVLLLLDEFPALGPMPPLERAVSLARGYGITCWLLAQDLSQLQTLYPASWSTFVANAGVVQAFGVNDLETATYLSAMLGRTTVQTRSRARSAPTGIALLARRGDVRASWTESALARALMSPDEVRRMDRDTTLLLMPGTDPVHARCVDYRRDREFAGAFDRNPMHGG